MLYPTQLKDGKLVRRYKRFLTDIIIDDQVMTVHCPNTGSMAGLLQEGNPVRISGPHNPERKYLYTLEQIRIRRPDGKRIWVGVNTIIPNKVVKEALIAGKIQGLEGYTSVRSEVKAGTHSRLDLMLESENLPRCWIEVKNVTMVLPDPASKNSVNEGVFACFPDAETSRGVKHIRVLTDLMREGEKAVMVYVIQRSDGLICAPAAAFDPKYASELRKAVAKGLNIIPVSTFVDKKGVRFKNILPFEI